MRRRGEERRGEERRGEERRGCCEDLSGHSNSAWWNRLSNDPSKVIDEASNLGCLCWEHCSV